VSAVTLAESDTHVVRGGCPHDCPDACSTLVTVERGRATRIAGDPDHPFTNGFLCAKVNRYLERTYHRDRLLYPLRRVGKKGTASFVRVSWDDAIGEIAERLSEIAASSDGPQAI
jgi:anaerobic selenocysteine-containing dehydrogenase